MKRVLGCGVVGFALVAVLLGSIAWAVFTYGRLARAQREVDRAWTEIEILCRERAETVPRFVESVRGRDGIDSAVLDRLLDARERSFEILATPELVIDTERFARFWSLQRGLASAVDEVLTATNPAGGVNDPAVRLEAIGAGLRTASTAFDDASAVYNDLLASAPSSWIARIGGFREAASFGEGR
jgi:LemA protein